MESLICLVPMQGNGDVHCAFVMLKSRGVVLKLRGNVPNEFLGAPYRRLVFRSQSEIEQSIPGSKGLR